MVREILLATDFSEPSRAAARVAVDYARRFGARLHLLHVVWPATDPTPRPALERLAEDLGREVPVVTAVVAGLPVAEEIVRYARTHGIDLIVVGTHGRTGPSRLLLGSVAERVVRTAPCPVLAVPAVAEREAEPAPEPAVAPSRCLVCAQPSPDLICEPCRARIRGEALERKQREERAGRA
jgi:nucleotide-binding universal stress UspA family protein